MNAVPQIAASASSTCQTFGPAGPPGSSNASIGSDSTVIAIIDIASGDSARQPNSASVSAWIRATLAR